jgi:hypothetical protein
VTKRRARVSVADMSTPTTQEPERCTSIVIVFEPICRNLALTTDLLQTCLRHLLNQTKSEYQSQSYHIQLVVVTHGCSTASCAYSLPRLYDVESLIAYMQALLERLHLIGSPGQPFGFLEGVALAESILCSDHANTKLCILLPSAHITGDAIMFGNHRTKAQLINAIHSTEIRLSILSHRNSTTYQQFFDSCRVPGSGQAREHIISLPAERKHLYLRGLPLWPTPKPDTPATPASPRLSKDSKLFDTSEKERG